jgi:hypothetical protein
MNASVSASSSPQSRESESLLSVRTSDAWDRAKRPGVRQSSAALPGPFPSPPTQSARGLAHSKTLRAICARGEDSRTGRGLAHGAGTRAWGEDSRTGRGLARGARTRAWGGDPRVGRGHARQRRGVRQSSAALPHSGSPLPPLAARTRSWVSHARRGRTRRRTS